MSILILVSDKKLDEHLEHFDPIEKKWKRCNSTKDNRCPHAHAPHRLAYKDFGCMCGKTMDDFLKHIDEMKKNIKKESE